MSADWSKIRLCSACGAGNPGSRATCIRCGGGSLGEAVGLSDIKERNLQFLEELRAKLIVALKSRNASVRREAAEGLGAYGQLGRSTVPALEAALADEEEAVRLAAAEALKKIRGEKPGK